MNNPNIPNANIDRRRVADELAREGTTSGGGARGPPTKRSKPDPSMTVTSAELMCAEEVKRVVEANEDSQIPLNPDRWSDYDYAQQALTTTADLTDEESTKEMLRKMYKLQAFREEYEIQDTVEEGVCLIQRLMEMMPGYVLSVDFAPRYGSYIAVFDYAAFRPERLRMAEAMRTWLGALYYIYQCLSTNIKAIRSGAVFITECQGMQDHNFNQQVEEKYIHHLFGHYPFRHKECLWLNTPSIACLAYGVLKSQMPGDFLATWRMGCKLDGFEGRIDSLFKMPTLAIAQEQLLVKIQGYLKERGQNARGFELHERMVYNPPPPPPRPAQAAARPGQAAGVNRAAAPQARPGVPQAQVRPGMPQARPGMPRAHHQARPGMPQAQVRPGMPQAQVRRGMPQARPGMPQPQARPGMYHGMPQAQARPGMPQPQARPGVPQARPGMPQAHPGMPRPGMPQGRSAVPPHHARAAVAQGPGVAPHANPTRRPVAVPAAPRSQALPAGATRIAPQAPGAAVRTATPAAATTDKTKANAQA